MRAPALQWIVVAVIALGIGAVAVHLTDGAPITKDAAQNLQMAINISHYGVMSLEENPPYSRSMYREPIPVAAGAAAVGIVDHVLGKADSPQYFSGDRAEFVKYQNTLWVILLWIAAFTAARWFSGSYWLSIAAGLLAVRPFLDGAATEGVNNLYTELPAAALMTYASLALVYAVTARRPWAMIAAGGCFGILTLTKAATLYIFIGLLLVLLLGYARIDIRNGRRQRLLHMTLLAATFAAVIAPWMVRNFQAFGRTQVSDRGGLVLYTRALMNQVTPSEYRGTFYVWARPSLQPFIGRMLGFTPQDLRPGGKLERLGGGPDSATYDHDKAAESAGRPQDAISFYRRARAERVRLEKAFESDRNPNPDVAADAMMQHEGMQLVKSNALANLAMAVPLTWRSAPLIFPLLAFALGYSLWVKRYTLALFVLPSFATLSFYALATHFEPRPATIARSAAIIAGAAILHAWWRGHRSFAKNNEIGENEVPNERHTDGDDFGRQRPIIPGQQGDDSG
jgi:hypothetical protein